MIDRKNTTIVNGAAKGRHRSPRFADQGADRGNHSDYDREKLQERLAKLAAASR